MSTSGSERVVVRVALPEDAHYAAAASRLIEAATKDHDIAGRSEETLRSKIETGRAAIALDGDELVGFGFWSDWEGGKFISHSGLVVDPSQRGTGLGRRLKLALFESSRERFPDATLMSLTTSEPVKKMNLSLGFRVVPLDQLTKDPAFWKGCETCRNFAEVQARGETCCCEGMIRRPEDAVG